MSDVTEKDLVEIVSYTKVNKAVGIDKIRPRDISVPIENLRPILLKLYNSVFNLCEPQKI